MKKILFTVITMILFAQSVNAEDGKQKQNDKLADVYISTGVTDIYIARVTNAEINTDPIMWMKFNTTFYIFGFEPSLGYSRSFNDQISNDSERKPSMQINLKIPLDKIGLRRWSINYDKYVFNTYLRADPGKKIRIVDKSNITYKSGRVNPYGDAGITPVEDGETASLSITSERLEIVKEIEKRFAGGESSYAGVFIEILNKPWEDPTDQWVDSNGNRITYVFSEVEFRSIGLTFGTARKNKELPSGFSVKGIGIDISFVDIKLTNNYSFKDKLGENMQTYKVGMKAELAYKMMQGFLGEDSSVVFNGFVNYDYYYLDIDTSSDQDESISLSNDLLFGVSATLNF